MSKKKRKKKYSSQKTSEALRREAEIKEYGKIISLRPSVAHDSAKTYKRIKKDWTEEE